MRFGKLREFPGEQFPVKLFLETLSLVELHSLEVFSIRLRVGGRQKSLEYRHDHRQRILFFLFQDFQCPADEDFLVGQVRTERERRPREYNLRAFATYAASERASGGWDKCSRDNTAEWPGRTNYSESP